MSTIPQPPKREGGTPITKRLTPRDIQARKNADPIVCITAHSAPMAGFMDPHVDLLLVGDSLGMMVYGLDTTVGVTLDIMIAHGKAVVRGSSKACVIVDLPFGSYQASPVDAFKAAARVMSETGCAGVKLEGGAVMAPTVEYLVSRGIPVMGHIGLTPQSVNVLGGFRVQGKSSDDAKKLVNDAKLLADCGAFSIVVEGTVEPVAREITKACAVPTIGIGASAGCDGQVIVAEDILGLYSAFMPKFAKRYALLGDEVTKAVASYAADVRARRFPAPENTYGAPAVKPTKPAKKSKKR
ncbi:MAG: 3-methyl-2-oxobutanoate hydroxymethyltransferase [Rhodospirillaceae bacterium]